MVIQRTAAAIMTAAALAAPAAAAQGQSFIDRIQDVAHARSATVRTERYQRGGAREEQSERITKTVRLGKDGELDISNISGDVGNDANIEIVKTARAATTDAAKEMLRLVEVVVEERAGRAEVRVNYGVNSGGGWTRWRNTNVSVAFTIRAPEGTRLTAKSLSGDIRVNDIKGEVSAESISGHVQISGGERVSAAKTMSGDVEIVDTQGQGSLEASSASGAVTLRNVKVRRLDAQSISGNVLLTAVDCERVSIQSMSGDVRSEGPLVRNGRYELKSHSGEVRVAVSGGSGFEIDANTFSGNVRSDFPIKAESMGPAPARFRRQSMHGTFGDGSAVLELNTFSGNIAITKK
jgi:DUF4097 and DUF4098 domain-containing protein YvlB